MIKSPSQSRTFGTTIMRKGGRKAIVLGKTGKEQAKSWTATERTAKAYTDLFHALHRDEDEVDQPVCIGAD